VKGHFHPLAWLAWLAASAFLIVQVRNPFYLLILLLGTLVVKRICAVNTAILPFSVARIGLLILLFSTLFHMLTVHLGRTVLWTLPPFWWLIGGPVTLESAVAGAINGLALLALLVLFVAFSAAVPVHELSHLTPPALRDLGIVLLIALTYMPQTARHWQQIREAQAVRGHRIQGWRDWRPIIIPLLTGGLERSVNLAEAMVARGYGSTGDSDQPIKIRLLLLGSLASILGGWVLSGWWPWSGWSLAGVGVLMIVFVYRWLGRRSPRTTYRVRHWTKRDSLLVLSATLLLLPAGLDRLFGRSTLYYSPYPVFTLPPFEPLVGVALALIAAPAMITLVGRDDFDS
jgi:energy-coupling factor transport system permease protein